MFILMTTSTLWAPRQIAASRVITARTSERRAGTLTAVVGAATELDQHGGQSDDACAADREATSETFAEVAGLHVGELSSVVGVGGREVGPEGDRGVVGDAGPVEPRVEVGLLEIVAECGAVGRSVDRAGVYDGGLLAGEQTGVAGVGIESEDHAGLGDDIDELLEDVGDARVPHRHAEQVGVGGGEPGESALRLVPGAALLALGLRAGEHRHLGGRRGRPELGQRPVPQVPGVDPVVGMRLPVGVEERAGDRKGPARVRFGMLEPMTFPAAPVSRQSHPALRQVLSKDYHGWSRPEDRVGRFVLPASLSVPLVVKIEDSPLRPPEFVNGVLDTHSVIEGGCAPRYLQIDLSPLGAYQVLGVPMDQLTGQLLDLNDVFGGDARRLGEQLRDLPAWTHRFDVL